MFEALKFDCTHKYYNVKVKRQISLVSLLCRKKKLVKTKAQKGCRNKSDKTNLTSWTQIETEGILKNFLQDHKVPYPQATNPQGRKSLMRSISPFTSSGLFYHNSLDRSNSIVNFPMFSLAYLGIYSIPSNV